ncbi:MAG: hypothetical protein IID06_04810, partial [Gemmatimonadetes bacterium]|nr:hypothetical protein [Gemmatimonadota bacterium]
VRGHAEALDAAGKALEHTEGNDLEVLALVGKRALAASESLWAIENIGPKGWDMRGDGAELYSTLWTLPLLVMAVEATATDPKALLPAGERWVWCEYQAERIAGVLMEWVEAHEPPPEYPTIEVDAAEIFGFSKATVEDQGEQPFPEGFEDDGLSGKLGHLWLIRHDELHEYSGEGIWYLPELGFDDGATSPFARLSADHSTLYPVSAEEVAPYISGFTPPAAEEVAS